MATNPYTNRVYKSNGEKIIDISDSTVTPEVLRAGFTAYNAAGEKITGVMPLISWQQLQQKVRNNDMSDISIGDQFMCSYGKSTLTWDVIGKNQDTPANTNYTHSLTLRLHDALDRSIEFDAPEAIYYCSSLLPAGTYYMQLYLGGSYQFTLTRSVPAGGHLVFLHYATSSIASYSSATSTTAIETVSTSTGTSGTNLGTIKSNTTNGNLNVYSYALNGNNSWEKSGLRQWLNSNQIAGNWWTPKSVWDRPIMFASTLNGFLYDLDPEFLEVLGQAKKKTVYNGVDGSTYYTTNDLFSVLSLTEVYGGNARDSYPEGQAYTFYSENSSLPAPGTGADPNRIVYRNGTATYYRLRTPKVPELSQSYAGGSNGSISKYNYTFDTTSILPVCYII